jgi:predicted MFS family arabinose efflux permease
MANAAGRLLGTVLSGFLYQQYGLNACLWFSSGLLLLTFAISFALPKQ